MGEVDNLVDGNVVDQALHTGINDGDLLSQDQGAELGVLEQLTQTLAALQLLLGGGIQIGSELREGGQFVELGQLQFQGAGNLLDGLGLGSTTHPAHGDTHVDRRPQTGVEQVGAEEDLTVRDRNHVGGDVGRNVTGLGFDDRQSCHGTLAHGVRQLGCTLKQTAVAVEDVAGVGLTTGRTTQQERHLAVSSSLLGKIVVDHQGGLALVHEVLGDGGAGVGSQVLQCSGLRGVGRHDHGVVEGATLTQHFNDVGHGSSLLTHGYVDADHVLIRLVQDRVDRDGVLAGLAVTNDQLALTTAYRDHRVDGGDAGLHRLMHRLALDDAGRHGFDQARLAGGDFALAVDGAAQGVHHPAQHGFTHGHSSDFAGGLHRAAFLNAVALTHQHRADVVVFEVQGDAFGAVLKFNKFAGHGLLQAVNAGDAVAHGQNGADIADGNRLVVVLNLLFEDGTDLVGTDGNHGVCPSWELGRK